MRPTDSRASGPFTFRGDALDVVRLADGDVGLSLRRLCEVLGLDWSGQLQRLGRLAEAGCRWATVGAVPMVGADGRTREMTILPRRSIPMWAATVDASRVAPEVRSKLVAYQDEAAEALARAFLDEPAAKGQLPLFPEIDRRPMLVALTQAMTAAAVAGDAPGLGVLNSALARLSPKATPLTRTRHAVPVDFPSEILAYVAGCSSPPTTKGQIVAGIHRQKAAGLAWVNGLLQTGDLVKTERGYEVAKKPAGETLQ